MAENHGIKVLAWDQGPWFYAAFNPPPRVVDGKKMLENPRCSKRLGYLMAAIFDVFRRTDAHKAVS